jgi:small GTP-binding protein
MAQQAAVEKDGVVVGKKNIRFLKKVLILGEGAVGKTSLISQYVTGKFTDRMEMTIQVDFHTKKIDLTTKDYQVNGTLSIWDLSGQLQFRDILIDHFAGSHAVIMAYDMNRLNTLLNLKEWVKIIEESNILNNRKVPIILIGTKKDLVSDWEDQEKYQQSEYIDELKKIIRIDKEFETSSLKGVNIDEPFDYLVNCFIGESIPKK